MNGVQMLQAIIEILVGGITGIAEGIGSGLTTLATSIFLTTTSSGGETSTTLSTFAVLTIVFAGISLAIGLSRLVVRWVSSLGGSRV